MPSENAHETPISVVIALPRPIYQNDGDFTDTDSFCSDFECSISEETTNTPNTTNTPTQQQTIQQKFKLYEDIDSLSESSDSDSESSEETWEDSDTSSKKKFKTSLLQLEENITWSSVTEEFKNVRDDWRERLKDSSSITNASSLLVEFSKYLLPSAICDPDYIYGTWTMGTNSPIMNFDSLCGMLLALEDSLIDTAFSEHWKEKVDTWRSNLEEVEDIYGYESDDLW